MRNLLLFRLGSLGDLLVTLPSISLLRRTLSPCFLWLVGRKDYGIALKKTGIVDECISSDEQWLAPVFSEDLLFNEEQRRWLQKFDGIMGWMQKEWRLRIDQSWLSLRHKNFHIFLHDERSQEMISRFFFHRTKEFLEGKGIKCPPFRECLRLPLSLSQEQEAKALLGERALIRKERVAVLHPGSGSREKCWPFRNFLQIIHRLHQSQVQGVLVTGPAEGWIEGEWDGSGLPPNWSWLRNPPLLPLAGLLKGALFYLGNDSGITHLAASCGTRTLALFRKGLEHVWKPYGRASVLSASSLEEIDAERVWAVIQGWLRNRKEGETVEERFQNWEEM